MPWRVSVLHPSRNSESFILLQFSHVCISGRISEDCSNGDKIFFLSSCPWVWAAYGLEMSVPSLTLLPWGDFQFNRQAGEALSTSHPSPVCLANSICGQSTCLFLLSYEDHTDRRQIWFLAEWFYCNWRKWSLFSKNLSLGQSVAELTLRPLPSSNFNKSTPLAFSGMVC